jgi:hypothetical protein
MSLSFFSRDIDVLRRMAFHYLEKLLSQKPSLEQIREYLSRYGKEKSVHRDCITVPAPPESGAEVKRGAEVERGSNAFTAGIHCGTNYKVLSNWMEDVPPEDNWFCDSDAPGNTKIVWKPTADKYKYEFVFHQAEIGDDDWRQLNASERVPDIVVGCSFHPKPADGFFKKI